MTYPSNHSHLSPLSVISFFISQIWLPTLHTTYV